MGNENAIEVKRFIAVRRDLGYTQSDFAKILGISNTTADVERGRTKLSGRVVATLLREFKINPLLLFRQPKKQYLIAGNTPVIPKEPMVD